MGRPREAASHSAVSFGGFTALFTIHDKSRPEIIIEPVGDGGTIPANFKAPAFAITRAPDVFVKLTETPFMPKNDLLSALRYTEGESAPFNLDSAATDAWIMDSGTPSVKMSSLFAAVPEKRAWGILDHAFPGFRGNSSVMVIPSAALGLARRAASLEANGVILLIYVDDGGFGLYAVSGGKIVFMRERPMRNPGDEAASHETAVNEIARSADFFERTSGKSFDSAWLLGHDRPDGLTHVLSSAIGMDVRVYDPSRDFSITFTNQMRIPRHLLPVMIGAAFDRGETIRITPRKKRHLRLLKKPAALAASVMAASFALTGLAYGYALGTLDDKIVALNAEVAALKKLAFGRESGMASLSALTSENGELGSKIETFEKSFAAPRPFFYGALRVLAANLPDNAAITRLDINMAKEEKDISRSPSVSLSRKNTRIEGIVKGSEADKSASVSALLSALSGSSSFRSVTLSRLRKEPPGSVNAGMTSFEIVGDLAISGKED